VGVKDENIGWGF